MPVASGVRLGPYEIVGPIGAGGMGEVYAARDTRLDRRVAIKILPAALAGDHEFRGRFEREARAISSLSHPHICALYDVGREQRADSPNAIEYLVLEYIEGESLAERLQRGPLPLSLLLTTAAEIAEALGAAHRAGIVHRDVKPANIVLTRAGGAKLLDFGIAKPHLGPGAAETMLATMSPITARGSFIGTPNYMAPEQVEGTEADARSDIFALGAVVYEMATGRRAFDGKTQASVIAAILAYDPPPVSTLQPLSPPELDRIVRKCLEKDPDSRWQSAVDLASELRWNADPGAVTSVRPAARASAAAAWQKVARWLPAIVAALLLVAALASARLTSRARPAPTVRAFINAPADVSFAFVGDDGGAPAITRDGRTLVFAGYTGGRRVLLTRALDATEIRPVPGTDDAKFPFWSPDGKSIGFFADGQLKRVDVMSGQAITVAPAADGRGGSWGDGFILYTPNIRDGIYRVNADGGQPHQVTHVDTRLHTTHRWPVVLPDNRHFLFFAGNHNLAQKEGVGIYIGSLDGAPAKFLVRATASGLYTPPGSLLYPRGQTLLAQPFDAERLLLGGEAAAVAEVTVDQTTWKTVVTASENGVLAYQSGSIAPSDLQWYDRSGKPVGVIEARDAGGISLSADGARLAVVQNVGPAPDIWVYDVRTGHGHRLTFQGVDGANPVWSPGGDMVIFSSHNSTPRGDLQIFRQRADGSGNRELVQKDEVSLQATDWSRDGKYLIVNRGDVPDLRIWAVPLVGDRRPFPVLKGNYDTFGGRLSPDGNWLAYSSREEGLEDVFITSFPDATGKWQVSNGGGTQPRWRGDGQELFYITPDSQIAAAPVHASGHSLEVGAPQTLFRAPFLTPSWQFLSYAVTADGKRFILPATKNSASVPITIHTNWQPR